MLTWGANAETNGFLSEMAEKNEKVSGGAGAIKASVGSAGGSCGHGVQGEPAMASEMGSETPAGIRHYLLLAVLFTVGTCFWIAFFEEVGR